MPDMNIELAEQIACVKREIGMRERLYPRWVLAGRMAQHAADRELAQMRAVLNTLEMVDVERRPSLFPR